MPVGRHIHWGQVVALDPIAWLQAGLVTNPGVFILGQPGVGKSALAKRLVVGMAGTGTTPLVLGDIKPDYVRLTDALGGQTIRVGRGQHRINPLDAGPLGDAAAQLHHAGHGHAGDQVLAEIRGRQIALVCALLAVGRNHQPVTPGEETVLAATIDHLATEHADEPTLRDVIAVLRDPPPHVLDAAEHDTVDQFLADTRDLRQTLRALCDGALRGILDGPTTTPLDLDAPAVNVDISAVASSGEDKTVAAAMLTTWAYGFATIDASLALAEAGLAPPRNYLVVLDELWRALRGAPGLVDRADALTRTNRQRGVAQLMLTHSLADLDALPIEPDRAKARGFVERSAITILGGLPPRELDAVAEIVGRLSDEERAMVTSWSTPTSWAGSDTHPGRGKYLIKAGPRVGIPVEMELTSHERPLYNTDTAITPGTRPGGYSS